MKYNRVRGSTKPTGIACWGFAMSVKVYEKQYERDVVYDAIKAKRAKRWNAHLVGQTDAGALASLLAKLKSLKSGDPTEMAFWSQSVKLTPKEMKMWCDVVPSTAHLRSSF